MEHALALVTGTSSGIGASVARLLLDRGWVVIGVARRAAPFDHPNYTHAAIDLSDVHDLPSMVESTIAPRIAARSWTRVALVNNAARADLLMPLERLEPTELLDMLALNTVAPIWLMGFVARVAPRDAVLRIVNVSTGAAVMAFPGLAAYGASKAALRMAGQVFAAELDSTVRRPPGPPDTAILSYQPGTVDTPMQTAARSVDVGVFPWSQLFRDFHARGMLVDPSEPAVEIVTFLESNSPPRLTERRLGAQ
jgi:benzil reductase ((S)-benzoin forming)